MTVYAHILGEAPVTLWRLSSRERYRRVLRQAGVTAIADDLSSVKPSDSVLIVRGDYLFDGRVLHDLAASLNIILEVPEGPSRRVVAAHVAANLVREACALLSGERSVNTLPSVRVERLEDRVSSFHKSLLKSAPPFVASIRIETKRALEERLFSHSYKGVTDLVTKWFWPVPARWATRLCVTLGLRPNHVTSISVLLVCAAGALFANGLYGWGLLAAWCMTFLDTVDGKLARVTVTSTRFGHFFDHIMDLIHPPFWYLLWGRGLESFYPGIPSLTLDLAMWVIFIGYIVGRLVEGTFEYWLGRYSIFCWRPFDSYFRLVMARRNPNLLLLTGSLALGRPDWGLVAVTVWTAVSTVLLLSRLGLAVYTRLVYGPLRSWLAEGTENGRDSSLAVRLFTDPLSSSASDV
ncbi:CDP-alcohol phosphatidyltransferase family protein [Candidatus Methylomirabilis sp.]|uniref:CDP-alcohol phosphatidyltransferase family protein n=1 Tax=Candidatus Methylomirabilis sp. TaxID=2032687 RepID=UPI0030760122